MSSSSSIDFWYSKVYFIPEIQRSYTLILLYSYNMKATTLKLNILPYPI
jgi:hypothetical protein